jgi:acetate kinase
MSKKYLIINTGSTSKKYSFYENENKIYTAHFEQEEENFVVTEKFAAETFKTIIDRDIYIKAIKFMVDSLIEKKIIANQSEINLSGIRIVAPGEYFLKNKFIDEEYLKMAEQALQKVPLHLAPALEEIKVLRNVLGDKHPIVGVSDSAFHATISDE